MGDLDEVDLAAFASVWSLVPRGQALRSFSDRIPDAFVQLVGPVDAKSEATHLLGDDPTAVANAAIAVKAMAGEIDTMLHAIGILAALPHVLEDGERIQAVSAAADGAGTRSRNPKLPGGDLVTDKQVAEFTFMRWHAKKSNGVRNSKVVADVLKLATEDVGRRRRVLYAMEGHRIERWLQTSGSNAHTAAASRNVTARLMQLGAPATVRELWAQVGSGTSKNIQIVHLPDVIENLVGFELPT